MNLRAALFSAGIVAVGCGSSQTTPTAPTTPAGPYALSMSLTNFDNKFGIGFAPTQVIQLYAEVKYSNGTSRSVSSDGIWSTTTPDVVTVTPSGKATGVAPGNATVQFRYSTVSGEATFRVCAIDDLEVQTRYAEPYMHPGATAALRALYHCGSSAGDVSETSKWQVSDPSIATISTAGLLTARGSGLVTVSATFNGMTGSGDVWVTPTECSYTVAPTRFTPDANLMVTYNGYFVQITAPSGCAWSAAPMGWSRFWEIRSSPSGSSIDGGTGSASVFLACTGAAHDCRWYIASFLIAGTSVTKWAYLDDPAFQ